MMIFSLFKFVVRSAVSIAILFGIWLWWQSSVGYLNLFPWCRIHIQHDVLKGDQDAIKAAINFLRALEPQAYALVCENVDVIYERYCYGNDWHFVDPKVWTTKPGCYVRGTHAVYLSPSRDISPSAVAARAESLERFASYSKAFWARE